MKRIRPTPRLNDQAYRVARRAAGKISLASGIPERWIIVPPDTSNKVGICWFSIGVATNECVADTVAAAPTVFVTVTPPLDEVHVAEYPIIVAPPAFAGGPYVTRIAAKPADTVTAVGALGATLPEVTQNNPVTPPTVMTTDVEVAGTAAAVTRIRTVWPLVTLPAALVNAPPLIENSPLVIVIAAAAVMPVIVTGFDITSEFGETLDCAAKSISSGIV